MSSQGGRWDRHKDSPSRSPSPSHKPRTSSGSLDIYEPRSLIYSNPLFPRASGRLTAAEQDFIRQVPVRNLELSIDTLARNPGLRSSPDTPRRYFHKAIEALTNGDRTLARNCIEKSLLIDKWFKAATNGDLKQYLQDLVQNGEEIDRFNADFHRLEAYCNEQAQERASAENRTQPAQRHFNLQERLVSDVSRMRLEDSSRTAERHLDPARSRDRSAAEIDPLLDDIIESTPRYSVQGSNSRRHVSQSLESDGDHYSTSVTSASRVSTASFEDRHIDYRDDLQNVILPKDLHDFKQRFGRDAVRVFVKYRVFAMITMHQKDTGPVDIQYRTTRKGEVAVVNLLLMAVVVEGPDFCWTIPIKTDQGQRVTKPPSNDAYAVIHVAGRKPTLARGEPDMKKQPIAVDLADGESLPLSSRINFEALRTVRHDVRHRNVGMIAQQSRPYFDRYCREYLTYKHQLSVRRTLTEGTAGTGQSRHQMQYQHERHGPRTSIDSLEEYPSKKSDRPSLVSKELRIVASLRAADFLVNGRPQKVTLDAKISVSKISDEVLRLLGLSTAREGEQDILFVRGQTWNVSKKVEITFEWYDRSRRQRCGLAFESQADLPFDMVFGLEAVQKLDLAALESTEPLRVYTISSPVYIPPKVGGKDDKDDVKRRKDEEERERRKKENEKEEAERKRRRDRQKKGVAPDRHR